jgi:protein TonB
MGDSWYARAVETRISSNWIRPPEGIRVDAIFSFFIASNGSIYEIKKEKSSGNDALDLTAERAIRASNPLAPPPPEMRGRPVQFVAHFLHPPD